MIISKRGDGDKMSYYVDKIQDKLAENSDIAIKQLENDDLIGNLEATYLLGKLYYDGIYRRPDAVKAVELWEKGAGNNDIDCLRALGDCYFFGFGYEENNEKAMEIYQEVLKKIQMIIGHFVRSVVCMAMDGVSRKMSRMQLHC